MTGFVSKMLCIRWVLFGAHWFQFTRRSNVCKKIPLVDDSSDEANRSSLWICKTTNAYTSVQLTMYAWCHKRVLFIFCYSPLLPLVCIHIVHYAIAAQQNLTTKQRCLFITFTNFYGRTRVCVCSQTRRCHLFSYVWMWPLYHLEIESLENGFIRMRKQSCR